MGAAFSVPFSIRKELGPNVPPDGGEQHSVLVAFVIRSSEGVDCVEFEVLLQHMLHMSHWYRFLVFKTWWNIHDADCGKGRHVPRGQKRRWVKLRFVRAFFG